MALGHIRICCLKHFNNYSKNYYSKSLHFYRWVLEFPRRELTQTVFKRKKKPVLFLLCKNVVLLFSPRPNLSLNFTH